VISELLIVRCLMHGAPHQRRLVTGLGKHLGHGWVVDRLLPEPHHAAGLRKQARHQGVASGDTRRNGSIGSSEERPLASQIVEVRRPNSGMTKDRQAIAAHLVRHDQQQIGWNRLLIVRPRQRADLPAPNSR
jgi:hypothetical protein